MANRYYTLGRQAFLEGGIAWLSDNIKCVLCDTSIYTPATSTDQYMGVAIASGARVAISGNLASKSSTGGTANAANLTFSAVSGAQCSLLAIYKDSGAVNTSPLILAIDTASNLPVTPNGGDINVSWDTGTNKIFTLFEGLSESDRLTAWQQLKRWFGWGGKAELSPGGIWIPAPRIEQSPAAA